METEVLKGNKHEFNFINNPNQKTKSWSINQSSRTVWDIQDENY